MEPATIESGWGLPVRMVQPRNPAWWVYVVFVAIGAFLWFKALGDAKVGATRKSDPWCSPPHLDSKPSMPCHFYG